MTAEGISNGDIATMPNTNFPVWNVLGNTQLGYRAARTSVDRRVARKDLVRSEKRAE